MAQTDFHIVLNIKTVDGFETYGRFFLGSDGDAAQNIFLRLSGSEKVSNKSILTLELVEISRNLPLDVQVISCTLEELTENIHIITREVFKLLNLKEM